MLNKSPCMDCENKGCGSFHDKCEKYIEYKKQRNKDFKKERNAKTKVIEADCVKRDGIKRMKSKKVSNGIIVSKKK